MENEYQQNKAMRQGNYKFMFQMLKEKRKKRRRRVAGEPKVIKEALK